MIGLNDTEFTILEQACLVSMGADITTPGTSDDEVAIDSLVERGLLLARWEDEDDADMVYVDPTPLGRILYRAEKAIRSGISPMLESRSSP